MTTGTTAKWAERVRDWKASGMTAEEFASAFDFEPTTLRYWSSRLKTTEPSSKAAPPIARVVRRRSRYSAAVRQTDSSTTPEVEVIIAGARIVVRHGFDAELLRQVATALGGTR